MEFFFYNFFFSTKKYFRAQNIFATTKKRNTSLCVCFGYNTVKNFFFCSKKNQRFYFFKIKETVKNKKIYKLRVKIVFLQICQAKIEATSESYCVRNANKK
jgi:hypothetical protein